jgi:hypothetical protein
MSSCFRFAVEQFGRRFGWTLTCVNYYFFEPFAPRLMRAWRKEARFSLSEHGGHLLTGSELKLAPEHLALRHYIVRNQKHAFTKYTTRVFADEGVARGWHRARRGQKAASFKFPPATMLRQLPFAEHRDLDRSDPWKVHYWMSTEAEPMANPGQCGTDTDSA